MKRSDAIKQLIVLPALAAALVSEGAPALASDNKRRFHYQDAPKDGKKCSECRFFRKPHSCTLVTGKISPNGWCIAWTKR